MCWVLAALALTSSGCDILDRVNNRRVELTEAWTKEDPMTVIAESTDGDKKARAYASLTEPKAGTKEHDYVVEKLCWACCKEPQAYCRLGAIEALSGFKDPRAVKALQDAYYAADHYAPETATVIRVQALAALGEIRDPQAVEFLARVAKEPPVEGVDSDRQAQIEVRLAATRSLGNFGHYQATEALVNIMKSERNVALQNRAHESLVAATGKDLPADPKAWEELLYRQGPPPGAAGPTRIAKPSPVELEPARPIRLTGGEQEQPR